jgi:hypothetical protein
MFYWGSDKGDDTRLRGGHMPPTDNTILCYLVGPNAAITQQGSPLEVRRPIHWSQTNLPVPAQPGLGQPTSCTARTRERVRVVRRRRNGARSAPPRLRIPIRHRGDPNTAPAPLTHKSVRLSVRSWALTYAAVGTSGLRLRRGASRPGTLASLARAGTVDRGGARRGRDLGC